MEDPLAPYRQAIVKRVEALCLDRDLDPASAVLTEITGRLYPLLPELVALANRAGPEHFTAFEAAVKDAICAHCSSQDANGVCPRRENGECCLSRYLPLLYSALTSASPTGQPTRSYRV